jgi:hypothetical protein
MSLNDFIVERAALFSARKLGVRGMLPIESFAHRESDFNRLSFGCAPSGRRTLRNSPERIPVL